MKTMLLAVALLLTSFALAQKPGSPPYSTPPTFPQGQERGQAPTRPTHPPDTKAPAPGELSNPEIQDQMQKKMSTEPSLANSNLAAGVDDKTVVLSGTVDNERQHEVALRIAQSYAGDRQIVDKIEVRRKT